MCPLVKKCHIFTYLALIACIYSSTTSISEFVKRNRKIRKSEQNSTFSKLQTSYILVSSFVLEITGKLSIHQLLLSPYLYQFSYCVYDEENKKTNKHILAVAWRDGESQREVCLFVRLFGFLKSLATIRLYHGRAPRQSV